MAGEQSMLLLSDLDPTKKRVSICVRVSRVWNYTRNGKVLRVDLVLIDEKGNKMSAEIASTHAPKYRTLLEEGNVYVLRDFFVQSSGNMFRTVDARFMIKITPWTKVIAKDDVPATFPYYAYCLTPFEMLPSLVGKKDSFTDIIGITTGISELLHVQLPRQPTQSIKRNLRVMDIDGRMIDVVLWGDQASNFDANSLYKDSQSKVLIVLIVGALVKNYRGRDTISCGDAAKIYINPSIPEKETYSESIGHQIPVVEWISAEQDQFRRTFQQSKPETVKIEHLLSTDPNEFLGKNMICTVTIVKVEPGSWWFLACSGCHKTAYPAGNAFKCSNDNCTCITAEPRYKVRLIGGDHTGEIEFIFFAAVAEKVIGKKVDVLIRSAACRPDVIPAEIMALVTQKYTLNVSINERGLQYGTISFQVNNIEVVHPKSKAFEFRSLVSSSKQQADTSTAIAPVESYPLENEVQPEVHSGAIIISPDDTNVKGDESGGTHDSNALTETAPVSIPSPISDQVPLTPPSITKHNIADIDDAGSVTKKEGNKRLAGELKISSTARKLFKTGHDDP